MTATDPSTTPSPPERWRVLWVLAAALLIVVIDVTVLHVAAPAIAADLRPSPTGLLWIIDVYPLIVAPLLVASASLGDRFGRKRALLTGLVVFTAASVMAGLSTSPGMLITARAIQGLGGALIMPSTMSLIRAVFPDRQERIRAIGVWSAVLAGGAAAGPLLGGVLVEQFTWHAVFLINVPILLAVLPFAIRILPESRHSDPPPWDGLSIVGAAVGVLLLVFGLKEAARHGLTEPAAAGSLVVSVIALTTFTRRQLRASRPMLDVRLLARPTFAVAVAGVTMVMFALIGLELFLAQYLQIVIGLEPLAASLRLVPLMLATLVGSFLAAPAIARLGSRATLAAGFAVAAASLLPLLALGTRDDVLLFVLPAIPLGMALQASLVAANDLILSSVSADDAGQASAMEETAYELGGGVGIAVLGALGSAIYTATLAVPAGIGSADASTARQSVTDAMATADRLPGSIGDALRASAADAWMTGFHTALVVSAVIIGVGAIATWIVARPVVTAAEAAARPAA